MRTAKEMREFAESNYFSRFNDYIKEIEDNIEEAAAHGLFQITYRLWHQEVPNYKGTPLEAYLEGIAHMGYWVETKETDEATEFLIGW